MIRCQLPAYSPLSPGRLGGAALRAAVAPEGGRRDLAQLLATRLDATRVVLTSSGTHALQTALALARGTPPWAGRPVALPAYTCYDVATAAVGAGVPVTFYDIDPDSLCPDPDGLRRVLTEGAGVLVANSLYGFPLDWDQVRRECASTETLLVEDGAQGLGSGWQGRDNGSFGDLSVLSFGRGKGWTGGGGGALLVRSAFLQKPGAAEVLDSIDLQPSGLARSARSFGVSLAQWGLGRPWLYGLPSSVPALALGETRYKEPTPPAAIAPFQAAAAVGHAEVARAETGARRAGAEAWKAFLDAGPARDRYRVPRPMVGGACGWLRHPLVASDQESRDRLVRAGRRLGIAAGYPRSLPELAVFQGVEARGRWDRCAGARELARRLLTLPTHSKTTERDRREIADLL